MKEADVTEPCWGQCGLKAENERLKAERDEARASRDELAEENARLKAGRDSSRAWREGAMLAGHGQPMPDIAERHRGRSSGEIAAFEMGFAFIHNSAVAIEMARRIDVVARRASTTEASRDELARALKGLHDDIAEYARINNLGGFDNHWMKAARAALATLEAK